jgi:hypothetical protein
MDIKSTISAKAFSLLREDSSHKSNGLFSVLFLISIICHHAGNRNIMISQSTQASLPADKVQNNIRVLLANRLAFVFGAGFKFVFS